RFLRDRQSIPLSSGQAINILDKWILARLNQVKSEVSKALNVYELDKASRSLAGFVDDLSTWYLRRSRERFKEIKDKRQEKDRENAITTIRFVLLEFSKIIAPFTPFIAEAIYQNLKFQKSNLKESIHLEGWPKVELRIKNNELRIIREMEEVRKLVSLVLEERAKAGIKVRQPLASLKIRNPKSEIRNKKGLIDLIKDEVNVKQMIFDGKIKNEVELDIIITPELKTEGNLRDLVRVIQDLRKQAGYTPKDRIEAYIYTDNRALKQLILDGAKNLKNVVGAKILNFQKTDKVESKIEIKIDSVNIWAGIKKIR
ncbi:MAG: class I tRNA ligase family protein, partial [Patescibacteria group bacterium]|nr:class I tRNA ligase family protein [Patescibacteria group bacterium]